MRKAILLLTHSYFVGMSVGLRFTTSVFSISSEPDGLYSEDYGIFANYNQRGRDWERAIYVEAFTKGGERIISQNAGMRVHGAKSRRYSQKSLRLIARTEYDPGAGRFRYPFFEGYMSSDVYARPIISHDTLILRNDGNDFSRARLRTPLASWIAKEARFSAVSPYSAAAVFINGEYYGYAALNVSMNQHFLQDLYNAPERAFDIIDGGSSFVGTDNESIINEFNQLLASAQDGFDDDEMQFLNECFDIDNLLLYYAFQVYIANSDWPDNNIAIWRYRGFTDTNYLADELDGRWRHLLWDLDYSMHSLDVYGPETKSILRLLDSSASPIFEALIQRTEYAEKFANHICDMAAEHFSSVNVQQVIQELDDLNLREQEESLLLYGRNIDRLMQRRGQVIAFVDQRPDYILAELRELFGYTGDKYRIVSDGTVKINTLNGNEGFYFVECNVPVAPILEKGYVFDHWLINGVKHYDEDLLISYWDADDDGVVFVSAVSRENFPPLFFSETYDTGTLFGFTMYNPTGATQSTRGLYLSDDVLDLKKWRFPALNIRHGSTWEFVGRGSTSIDSLLKIGLNFNPRHGEAVFLSNEDGVILDWIAMMP